MTEKLTDIWPDEEEEHDSSMIGCAVFQGHYSQFLVGDVVFRLSDDNSTREGKLKERIENILLKLDEAAFEAGITVPELMGYDNASRTTH